MGKTTDYQQWLSNLNPKGAEDIYNSVNNFERSGKFYTSKNVANEGYEYLVKADGVQEILFLASDQEKFSMLQHLKANYTDAGDDQIDKWYELKKDTARID